MSERGRFDGKCVAITGGASGLGSAIVDTFIAAGAFVAILDRSERSLAQIEAKHAGRIVTVAGDVRSYADNRALVERAHSAYGRLDTFIGNAGSLRRQGADRDV